MLLWNVISAERLGVFSSKTRSDSNTKQDTIMHDMMTAIVVPLCEWKQYLQQYNLQIENSGLKPQLRQTSFAHVSLFVTKALAHIRERILYEKWQDQYWVVLCCSWDLICLPLADINGWEETTQKKHIWMHKEVNKPKQKTRNMHRTLAAHQSTCSERRGYKLCWRFHCSFLPSSSSDHGEI